ncbi:MAG: glutamate--tRNA ligase [Rhodospirillaceae bacterium]|nr:glutamate--tRNA ligase [Rhodospirillaceae bacterium]
MTVVTRFAPSPTGFLHIGGARTALFNWLYSRHMGGKFLLRIEDTDRARSTDEATAAIIHGMGWLGLDADEEPTSQYSRQLNHVDVAKKLLAEGKAYNCYCSPEELSEMREKAKSEGKPMRYDGRWRDRDASDAPQGIPPVIRIKAEQTGTTTINDIIQGDVSVENTEIDDFVLLRADGTPTYMLAVVVDDHDMGITHVIRGDDHLTNTFRQIQLYKAMGWDLPIFAHMPLLHGADGKKLSKRHGALGVEAYEEMGFLPEAVCNYLLRLGWGHGDDEIISSKQAIEWFDVADVGKAAARFDMDKLTSLNAHYIRGADDERLTQLIMPKITEILSGNMSNDAENRLKSGMAGLKERAKTIVELSENAAFYCKNRPLSMNDKAAKLLNGDGPDMLADFSAILLKTDDWSAPALEEKARAFSESAGCKLGAVMQPLRAALTGSNSSPGMFEVLEILGKEETLGRIDDALSAPK